MINQDAPGVPRGTHARSDAFARRILGLYLPPHPPAWEKSVFYGAVELRAREALEGRAKKRMEKAKAINTRRARADERHGGGERTVLGTMRAAPILFSEIPISHGFRRREGGTVVAG